MPFNCGKATALALIVGAVAGTAAAQTVALSAAQERAIGIRTVPLSAAGAAPIATISGTFEPPPGGRAAVSVPFAGVVQRVEVIEGQPVVAGQTLAVVFSREALAASADMQQAQAESRAATAAAARTRRLVDEGVVAGARADEADARADAARAAAAQRSLSVRTAGVDAAGRFRLTAPFAGRVSRVDVEAGGGVQAMATAFVVDRQDRILIQANLPAALAGAVRPGQRAAVEGVAARIIAVGAQIDPRTRSLTVHAEAPARPGFIPGRAARLEVFAAEAAGRVSAPRSAVTPLGGRTVVFVRTARGYVATPVAVEGYSTDRVIMRGSIAPGAAVAVTGLSELKARAGG